MNAVGLRRFVRRTTPRRLAGDGRKERVDTPNRDAVQKWTRLCDALQHPERLRVLLLLVSGGEASVSELCERLDSTQPMVSHHLAVMRRLGLVR